MQRLADAYSGDARSSFDRIHHCPCSFSILNRFWKHADSTFTWSDLSRTPPQFAFSDTLTVTRMLKSRADLSFRPIFLYGLNQSAACSIRPPAPSRLLPYGMLRVRNHSETSGPEKFQKFQEFFQGSDWVLIRAGL